jgi:hypothetical protein
VIARDPHDDRVELGSHRLDRRSEAAIGVGLPQIGEVSRHHDRRRVRMHSSDRVQGAREVLLHVVPSTETRSPGQEMRIADMDEHVRRGLMPTEHVLLTESRRHGTSLGGSTLSRPAEMHRVSACPGTTTAVVLPVA